MGRDLTAEMERWLREGSPEIGQIRIEELPDGFLLTHVEDAGCPDLERFEGPVSARDLARDDAEGRFRPLKSAPNLRRGWVLRVADAEEVRLAIDYFYPAALGLNRSRLRGALKPVDLRGTLERQTGMYAVTRHITDEDADALVGRCCNSEGGCLRKILWRIEQGRPVRSLPAEKFDPSTEEGIPLLCNEVCNLLVAEARKVVKARKRE